MMSKKVRAMNVLRKLMPVGALLGFLASGPAIAATDEEMRRELMKGLENLQVSEVARKVGVAPHLQPVMEEHLRLVFADQKVREFIVDELIRLMPAALQADEETASALMRDFGAALIQDRIALGMRRLEAADQRQFYLAAAKLMSSMPASECAAMIAGTLTAHRLRRAKWRRCQACRTASQRATWRWQGGQSLQRSTTDRSMFP